MNNKKNKTTYNKERIIKLQYKEQIKLNKLGVNRDIILLAKE